jgi:hypothetical protein
MPLLRKRSQIAIKQEAVAGTAEALALADVVLHTDIPEWDPDVTMVPRAAMSASLSPRGSVVGSKAAKISWKQFLRGTALAPVTATNEPDFSVPFKGCGAQAVVSGAPTDEQTSFTPNTTLVVDPTSGCYCTVALYEDGKIYKIHGAVGNCTLTFTVGSPVLAEFEFTGVYNAPVDGALLAPSYPTVIEPAFLDAALTVHAYATAKLRALTLNFGNEIAMRPDPNDTSGFFTAQIVGRNPTGTIDVEEVLVSGKDWFANWIAGTAGVITTGVFPAAGTNYNQLQLTIPKAQYTKVGHGDRDGIATAPIDFECNATLDAGEDEWELVQT